jgi:hypothetical protein
MAVTWVFHTPHLGMPQIDVSLPASTAAGRSTPGPWANDILRAQHPTYGTGEFVYMKGATNTVPGSWVTYNTDDSTTQLLASTATEPGLVGIAMSANVAGQWGWYQIAGKAIGLAAVGLTDNSNVYASATAGTVSGTVAAGFRVVKAKAASAVGTPAAGMAEFEIERPSLTAGVAS